MREVQATVRSWEDRSGSVLLDDGTEVAYGADAVRAEVRLLRPGQRVRLLLDGDRARSLTLPGLPLDPPPG